MLDKRVHAYRDDRAAASLRGQVEAREFVEGESAQIIAGIAPMHRRPGAHEPLDTQLVYGDSVTIYENRGDGWLWVQNERDDYVGYIAADRVSFDVALASHHVAVLRTFVYPEPNMKLPPLLALPLAAEVHEYEKEGDFSRIGTGRWVWRAHLTEKLAAAPDFVAVAETMLGTPYLWGGNTPDGTDCSGLVQTALRMVNINAPRDSDMQEQQLGVAQPVATAMHHLQRGDLIFWKGHVAIMQDATMMLHANGHHMLVVSEPLQTAIARIEAKGGGPVTSVRRLQI